MTHKVIARSHVANTVNVVSAPITGHTFLGLLELSDTDTWGFEVENRVFCGAHLRTKICKSILSNSSEKEEKQIEDGKTTVIFLCGPGDKSYIKRFPSKADALSWFHKAVGINKDQDGSMLLVEETGES